MSSVERNESDAVRRMRDWSAANHRMSASDHLDVLAVMAENERLSAVGVRTIAAQAELIGVLRAQVAQYGYVFVLLADMVPQLCTAVGESFDEVVPADVQVMLDQLRAAFAQPPAGA